MGLPAVSRTVAFTSLVCLLLLVILPTPAAALETDQFTVPEKPLADIGPELSAKVVQTIQQVVDEANGKAYWHARQAERATWSFWRNHHRGKAAQYRSEDHIARQVYLKLAAGAVPECEVERWVRGHDFATAAGGTPVLFRRSCGQAVFGNSPLSKPVFLAHLSPTVNVHGTYVGLDKVGHLFQQGYQYFKIYCDEERRGGDEPKRLARAIKLGVSQERGFYGVAVVGVYSNADLAANYAGLKFYLNLTRRVEIDGRPYPPILRRTDAGWALDVAPEDDLLRAFVSDHFNEALNPSHYARQMRRTIRANVRRRADGLIAFYQTTRDEERARQARLATWHGEPYGHSGSDHLITIADTCFPIADETDAVETAGQRVPGTPARKPLYAGQRPREKR